ncbi:MAG: hypothetical protein OXR82_10925 [Gammaproteobacteria bacterium]|nr:hypothetical protein [Gammaproteobacteria bacterium]MDE0258878.1 hypothetical protein [Gammaproteobacteria bacterium]
MEMFDEVRKQVEFFKRNRNDLVLDHRGKYVIIHGGRVVDACDGEAEAYDLAVRRHKLEPGRFSIHHCVPETEDPPAVFHSRVA